MPFDLQVKSNAHYVSLKLSGSPTKSDIFDSVMKSIELAPDASMLGTLWDFRGVDFSNISAIEIARLAKELRTAIEEAEGKDARTNPEGRGAILTNSAVLRGLWNMFQVYSKGKDRDLRFFDHEEDAIAWLLEYYDSSLQ